MTNRTSVGSRLVVSMIGKNKTTKNGIILTPTTSKESISKGIVESVGSLCEQAIGHNVQKGDMVTFDAFSAVLLEECGDKDGNGDLYIIPANAIYTIEESQKVLEKRQEVALSNESVVSAQATERKILKD